MANPNQTRPARPGSRELGMLAILLVLFCVPVAFGPDSRSAFYDRDNFAFLSRHLALLGMFAIGTTTADVVAAVLLTATLGGTFAPASIALARRAELRDGASPALTIPASDPTE